jgi:hypothetical protein
MGAESAPTQTIKLRFVILVLELFVLNCLMDFLIEEDFDKSVKKEEFIDLIIVVY